MQRKTKGRIAGGLALVVLLLAGLIVFALMQMDADGNPSPSPNSKDKKAKVDKDGFPDVDWDYWKKVNPDVIGWVTVPGTNIDSPIVQAHKSDPEYYLHHDVYKKYNVYGCPYLDANCEDGLESKNAVVFGHHMNNQTVFSAFSKYSDKGFAKKHAKILVQVPDGKAVVKAKFAKVINGRTDRSKRTDFSDQEDFEKWYSDVAETADMKLDTTTPERTFTFVTCSYSRFANERTLVFASK